MKKLSEHEDALAVVRRERLRAGVACDSCGEEMLYQALQVFFFHPPRSAFVLCVNRRCEQHGERRSKSLQPGDLDGIFFEADGAK